MLRIICHLHNCTIKYRYQIHKIQIKHQAHTYYVFKFNLINNWLIFVSSEYYCYDRDWPFDYCFGHIFKQRNNFITNFARCDRKSIDLPFDLDNRWRFDTAQVWRIIPLRSLPWFLSLTSLVLWLEMYWLRFSYNKTTLSSFGCSYVQLKNRNATNTILMNPNTQIKRTDKNHFFPKILKIWIPFIGELCSFPNNIKTGALKSNYVL